MSDLPPFYVSLKNTVEEIIEILSEHPEFVSDDWFPNSKVEEISGVSSRVRGSVYRFLRQGKYLFDKKPVGLDYQQMLAFMVFRRYVKERGECYAAKKLIQLKGEIENVRACISNV